MKLHHIVFLVVLALMVLAPTFLLKGMAYALVVLLVLFVPITIASWFVPRKR
ncbi:hypothetical protein ACSMFT_23060 [Ectopseudomonas oleovorans]|uniref:hypothetical protein n=1 Tax=Ectopseudomonas TaxID=3236654 RepID=UPI0013046EA9|nr:hypothetical protein [Pseudomonas toyotomiensis]